MQPHMRWITVSKITITLVLKIFLCQKLNKELIFHLITKYFRIYKCDYTYIKLEYTEFYEKKKKTFLKYKNVFKKLSKFKWCSSVSQFEINDLFSGSLSISIWKLSIYFSQVPCWNNNKKDILCTSHWLWTLSSMNRIM